MISKNGGYAGVGTTTRPAGGTNTSSAPAIPTSTSATGKMRAGATTQSYALAKNPAHAVVSSVRSAGT